jgi:hypothetical protein
VFVVTITAIIIAVKTIVLSGLKEKNIFTTLYQPKKEKIRSFYFTGTSRMKCAINDSLLNKSLSNCQFFNAGLGYGTFISNAVLANKLMSSVDSPVIFIELSVANGRMPYTFSLVSDPANTVSSLAPFIKETTLEDVYHIYGPFTESYFIDYINLKPYLKLFSGNYVLTDFFGQLKKYDSLQYDPQSFLTEEDLTITDAMNADVPSTYHYIIQQILTKAEQTNSRIVFSLPVCISDPEEKKRLLAVYSTIPEKNKLHYSSAFLKEINKPGHLADAMHLNVKGADIYTNYIKQVIQEKFIAIQ